MIKKIKMLILSFSSLILFAMPMAATAVAATGQGDINGGLSCGSNGDFTATTCQTPDASGTVNSLITTVVNILSIAVGVIAVIMIIVAGFRYVASGGKQESVTSAKNTILYAIIGLVIVALAQIIVHFVLNKTNTATANAG